MAVLFLHDVRQANPARLVEHRGFFWLLFAVIVLLWFAGWPRGIYFPYWFIGYQQAFIRRGILGTIVQPFVLGQGMHDADVIITRFCLVGSMAALLLIAQALRRMPPAIIAAFLISAALPLMVRAPGSGGFGSPDPFVMAIAFSAIVSPLWPVTVALCLLGPLVHEVSLLLLVPALGAAFLMRPDQRWGTAWGIAAAIASFAAVMMFATHDFTWPPTPEWLPPSLLEEFARGQLGQSLRPRWPDPTWRSVVWSVLPAIAIVAVAWRHYGWRIAALTSAAVLSMWSVVFFASDVERFLAWGPLAAVLTLYRLRPVAFAPTPA